MKDHEFQLTLDQAERVIETARAEIRLLREENEALRALLELWERVDNLEERLGRLEN